MSLSENSNEISGHALNRRDPSKIMSEMKDQPPKPVRHSIEKGRQTRFYFERVLNFDYCLLVFSLINIALSVIYSDAAFLGKPSVVRVCLWFMFGTLLIEVAVTVLRYQAQVELEKSQKILDDEETIMTSGKGGTLLIEIIILLLQPYYFLEQLTIKMNDSYDGITFDYKVNYILVFFGFFKLFIILRVILTNTAYMSPRSSRLSRMYGCQSHYLYAIKCLFKDSPMLLIGIVFIASIFIFALTLRIAEREVPTILAELNAASPGRFDVTSNDISDFSNAVWLTIITMTTVGYGDYYPRTTFGRIIDVILVVWGTFIVSLMVVVLTNTLNMDQSEKRALIVLNRLEAKKTLKEAAALLITHTCKKYLIKKGIRLKRRPPMTQEEESNMQSTFYKYLTNFQAVHRSIRSMYEIDDVYEEMTRQFQFINDEINFLLGSQKDTIQNLQMYLSKSQPKQLRSQETE